MNYTYTHLIYFSEKYKFTTCKKLINTITNNTIKKVYNNGCIGYNIDGKFKSLTLLRKSLVSIPKMSDDLKFLLNQF